MRLALAVAALVVAAIPGVRPVTLPWGGSNWSHSSQDSVDSSTASLGQTTTGMYGLRAESLKQQVLTSMLACHRSKTLASLEQRIKSFEKEYSMANRIGFVLYHKSDNSFGIAPFNVGAQSLKTGGSPDAASVDRFITKLYRPSNDGVEFIRYLVTKVPTWSGTAKWCPRFTF